MENMFSISFRKHRDKVKENNSLTLIIKMWILFARAIITSTTHASSVSAISVRNFLGLLTIYIQQNMLRDYSDLEHIEFNTVTALFIRLTHLSVSFHINWSLLKYTSTMWSVLTRCSKCYNIPLQNMVKIKTLQSIIIYFTIFQYSDLFFFRRGCVPAVCWRHVDSGAVLLRSSAASFRRYAGRRTPSVHLSLVQTRDLWAICFIWF